jgi:hypothetical protein
VDAPELLPDIEPDEAPVVSPETPPALAPAPDDRIPEPVPPPEPAPVVEPDTAPEPVWAPPLPPLEHDVARLAAPIATKTATHRFGSNPNVEALFIQPLVGNVTVKDRDSEGSHYFRSPFLREATDALNPLG